MKKIKKIYNYPFHYVLKSLNFLGFFYFQELSQKNLFYQIFKNLI